MENNALRLTFGGEAHHIDTNTLIAELTHVTTVLNMVNRELGDGSREIKINVNAIEKGSFVIELGVVESFLKTIFSSNNIEYVAAVTTVATAVYKLYQKYKGRKVATENKDEAVSIVNSQGNILSMNGNVTIEKIVNIYNNTTTREAISSGIRAAREDGNIESINISDNCQSVKYEKDEFDDLEYDDFVKEEASHEPKYEEKDAVLTIKQLNFEKGNQWKFYWDGIEIKLKVSEGALFKQIENGARFGKGDKIKVRLRINKVWNDNYSCYENKGYSIEEFYELIQQNVQGKMDM